MLCLPGPSTSRRYKAAIGDAGRRLEIFKFPYDRGFLDRFRAGERAVLARVYAEYVDEVECIVRSFFESRCQRQRLFFHSVDLEDVVQEIFARAFAESARLAFDAELPYGPFLGAMARNLVIDWTRRRYPEIGAEDVELVASIPEPEVESSWADAETMSLVNDYIGQLSLELRKIHELRYVASQTQEQTCKALGLSRQQLRTREMHLRDGLRRFLKRANIRPGRSPAFASREGGESPRRPFSARTLRAKDGDAGTSREAVRGGQSMLRDPTSPSRAL